MPSITGCSLVTQQSVGYYEWLIRQGRADFPIGAGVDTEYLRASSGTLFVAAREGTLHVYHEGFSGQFPRSGDGQNRNSRPQQWLLIPKPTSSL